MIGHMVKPAISTRSQKDNQEIEGRLEALEVRIDQLFDRINKLWDEALELADPSSRKEGKTDVPL